MTQPDIDRVLEAADAETLRRMVRVLAAPLDGKQHRDMVHRCHNLMHDHRISLEDAHILWAEAEARRSLSQAEVKASLPDYARMASTRDTTPAVTHGTRAEEGGDEAETDALCDLAFGKHTLTLSPPTHEPDTHEVTP